MTTEVVTGKEATIHFDAQKCIHSRICVLLHPDVFVPNVVGAWIHPDAQIIALHGNDALLANAIGGDTKGNVSLAAYLIAIPLACNPVRSAIEPVLAAPVNYRQA